MERNNIFWDESKAKLKSFETKWRMDPKRKRLVFSALTMLLASSHNTRGAAKNHLQLSSANNKFGLKTFACRAPKLWNDLPLQLLEIESLLKFKTSVNDFFQKM